MASSSIATIDLEDLNASTPKKKDKISGCQNQNLVLRERAFNKRGLSSLLYNKCLNFDLFYKFFTSMPFGRGLDVNKRIVYTICALRHIHSVIEKSLVNMTHKTYTKFEETMTDAVIEVRDMHSVSDDDGVTDICIWQRRPFSSLQGVVTFMPTGEILEKFNHQVLWENGGSVCQTYL